MQRPSSLLLLLLGLGLLLTPPPARAQLADPEGPSASGTNDTLATATAVGTVMSNSEILINGWVDDGNRDDLDFYQFNVEAPETTVFLDVDFANDFNQVADDDVGLDSKMWVFDASGTLLAFNDDNDFFVLPPGNAGTDPGSDPFGDLDPFIGSLALGPGSYAVVVGWWGKFANEELGASTTPLSDSGVAVNGALVDTTFTLADATGPCQDITCFGAYTLGIRTTLAAPEPGHAAGAGAALLALGATALRRRRV